MINNNKTNMKTIYSFISRHSVWISIGLISLWLLGWGLAELKTILVILTIESLALALSGFCLFAYTNIDFVRGLYQSREKEDTKSNYFLIQAISFIFLGVHILVGLTVLGVYIAQFSN
jgi:hypothetical protein